jgi:hypothetical protein
MFRRQLIGFAGALAAIVTLALLWHFRDALPHRQPAGDDLQDRLAFAAAWLLLPGLALLSGVVGAARRGFYRDAIDGTRTPASPALEINLRYNQNTLEQVVLAAISWAGLAIRLPADLLYLVPALAVIFLAARLAFFIGYLIYPVGRTFGMTLTIIPTILAYVWLLEQL